MTNTELYRVFQIFDYHPHFDAFTVTAEYKALAEKLHWTDGPDVLGWVGALLLLDHVRGERLFWPRRNARFDRARWAELEAGVARLGVIAHATAARNEVFVVDPELFIRGADGPAHPSTLRKAFWTDLFSSLRLDLETVLLAAREQAERDGRYNGQWAVADPRDPLRPIDELAEQLRRRYAETFPECQAEWAFEDLRRKSGMVRVFDYLRRFDIFLPSADYARLADRLRFKEFDADGLGHLNWIGKLLLMDDDYGEKLFWRSKDVMRLRATLESRGIWDLPMLRIEAREFVDLAARCLGNREPDYTGQVVRIRGYDPRPCHSDALRKAFWTDVLRSLHLRLDTVLAAAEFEAQDLTDDPGHDPEVAAHMEAAIARFRRRLPRPAVSVPAGSEQPPLSAPVAKPHGLRPGDRLHRGCRGAPWLLLAIAGRKAGEEDIEFAAIAVTPERLGRVRAAVHALYGGTADGFTQSALIVLDQDLEDDTLWLVRTPELLALHDMETGRTVGDMLEADPWQRPFFWIDRIPEAVRDPVEDLGHGAHRIRTEPERVEVMVRRDTVCWLATWDEWQDPVRVVTVTAPIPVFDFERPPACPDRASA